MTKWQDLLEKYGKPTPWPYPIRYDEEHEIETDAGVCAEPYRAGIEGEVQSDQRIETAFLVGIEDEMIVRINPAGGLVVKVDRALTA